MLNRIKTAGPMILAAVAFAALRGAIARNWRLFMKLLIDLLVHTAEGSVSSEADDDAHCGEEAGAQAKPNAPHHTRWAPTVALSGPEFWQGQLS